MVTSSLVPWHHPARRFLTDSDDDETEVERNFVWLYLFTACLYFSFLATLAASIHIRRLGGGDEFRSAVRFVTTTFLTCTSIHALMGGLFYSYLIATMSKWVDQVDHVFDQYKDKGGSGGESSGSGHLPSFEEMFDGSSSMEGVESLLRPDVNNDGAEAAFISKLVHDYKRMPPVLTLLLCLENIFFVLGAYWIFLVTRELYKLAKITHDRGDANERRQILIYASGAMLILFSFMVAGILVLMLDDGSLKSYRILNVCEYTAIIVSIFYSLGSLLKLRFTGRKNEHIHGMLLASPLYKRLKMMMIVCILFTLPYSIMQLVLVGLDPKYIECIPDYVVGMFTTLYYLFGSAQALVMGGSQQCCLRILRPLIPAHVRNSPEWRAMEGTRRHGTATMHSQELEVTPPTKPVFVNTDIESSSALWAQAPQHVIDDAQRIHDDLLRSLLPKFGGYEITTAGDAFQLAFHSIGDAVSYCLQVQQQLVQAKWPPEIEGVLPSTKTEREFGLKCNALFRGLRIRMGVHDADEAEEGVLIPQRHPVTGKTLYIGASELIAREIGDLGYGGEVIVSKRVAAWLRNNEDKMLSPFIVDYYGSHVFAALDMEVELYDVTLKALDGRRKIFRKRREAERKGDTGTAAASPASHTASTGSAGEDSTTEFRAHRSPTESERKVWTIA